jgi:hypothetical protein
MALECLDGASSVCLLCVLCDRGVESLSDDERRAAEQLCVSELGGLPLAIEQAGAYMRGRGMGFVAYLSLYRSEWQSLFGVEARMSVVDAAMEWQRRLRVSGVDAAVIVALVGYGVRTLEDLRVLSASREDCMAAVSSLSPMLCTTLWRVLSSGDGVPVASDASRRSVRTELSLRSLSVGMWRRVASVVFELAGEVVVVIVAGVDASTSASCRVGGVASGCARDVGDGVHGRVDSWSGAVGVVCGVTRAGIGCGDVDAAVAAACTCAV